ncbi:MAG: S-methyl-5-thioribose-1-phosphate isomerase, partial [Planctomycetaceae bacterium]|nr:S-methyl-5-thioribose-1-phosphate isomerase [Planctomycetaceae bacterium]
MTETTKVETMIWQGGVSGCLDMIDQTKLPTEMVRIECEDVETVWEAIKMLRVRGAPAIGIAAAYGVVLGLQSVEEGEEALFTRLNEVVEYLATSRPTAVNLFWALERMRRFADRERVNFAGVDQLRESLLAEAKAIHEE